jgi:hypothetical protein
MSLSERIGMFDTRTVGFDGVQGDAIAGTHGIGVRTPKAAAVAAATIGLAGFEHSPNGLILAIGMKSIIEATGSPQASTGGPFGMTVSGDGATPKLHLQSAPLAMTFGISRFHGTGS